MKHTISILSLFPLAAIMLVSSTSHAGNDLFKSLDVNQDTQISAEEAQNTPALLENWKLIDTDSNGSISSLELSQYMNASSTQETPPSK